MYESCEILEAEAGVWGGSQQCVTGCVCAWHAWFHDVVPRAAAANQSCSVCGARCERGTQVSVVKSCRWGGVARARKRIIHYYSAFNMAENGAKQPRASACWLEAAPPELTEGEGSKMKRVHVR